MSSKKSKTMVNKKKYTKFVITLCVVALLAVYDLSGFGGNARFYVKWIECGRKPVGTNLEGTYEGTVPYYGTSPTFSLARLSPTYFCTPLEAEKAGYSANSQRYEFPHLKHE